MAMVHCFSPRRVLVLRGRVVVSAMNITLPVQLFFSLYTITMKYWNTIYFAQFSKILHPANGSNIKVLMYNNTENRDGRRNTKNEMLQTHKYNCSYWSAIFCQCVITKSAHPRA